MIKECYDAVEVPIPSEDIGERIFFTLRHIYWVPYLTKVVLIGNYFVVVF